MAVKDLTFRLFGEDSTASSSLRRLSVQANKTGEQFEKSFSKTKAVLGGVALAGVAAVGLLVKTGIGEAMDASAGLAQLNAGIKSTGGAANVSSGHMEDLASKIQNYSGQTDDSIVATEQLLLTFTNIKNRGPNKIFDDTTVAASNMAAKMGGDASKYAIQLGKALNDPEKGLSKLTKVGVTFTEGQKKQVAAMVKAGNTAGAQKVILGELNKEFGGAAKAAGESLPGQLQRVQRAFEDVSQTVVEAILPVVTPMIGKITAAIKASTPTLTAWAKKFAEFGTWVAANLPMIMQIAGVILGLVAAFKIAAVIIEAVRIATTLWTAAQWLFNAAADANPIGLIVIAIVALIAVVVLLVTHWSQVCTFLKNVWGAVCKWFQDTIKAIGAAWAHGWDQIATFFTTVWNGIVTWFKAAGSAFLNANRVLWNGIVTWIKGVWNGFVGFFHGLWNGIVRFGVAVVRGYVTTVQGVWSGIIGWLHDLLNGYLGFWRDLWNSIVTAARSAWDAAITFLQGIPKDVSDAFSGAGTWLLDAGKFVIDGFVNGIKAMIGNVTNVVSSIANGVVDTFKNVLGIHSPSRVFTEHGKNIVQGLVNGLVGNTSAVHAAVAGLVPGMGGSSAIGINVAGSGGAAAVAYGAGGRGGVVVNVTVQGAMVGTSAQLGQYVVNAIRTGTRQGAIPKNVFGTL